MIQPRVAVLVAVYNGGLYLEEQLHSIYNQKGEFRCDIIIHDDGSTDNSLEIINEFLIRDNFFLINDNIHLGSAAMNFFHLIKSINLGEYDFILFSDQDDIWLENKIISAIELMNLKNAHCYFSNLQPFGLGIKNGGILKKSYPVVAFDYLFQGGSAGCTYCLTSNASKFVCKYIDALDISHCSNISHDWFFYAMTRAAGYSWAIDSTPLVLYRQHNNNVHGALTGIKGILKKIKFLSNNWYSSNVRMIFKCVSAVQQIHPLLYSAIVYKRRSLSIYLFLLVNIFNFRRRKVESVTVFLLILFNLI